MGSNSGDSRMKNCPTCKSEIVIRNGKFGEFACCPKGHGTFSIQNGVMYFKGAVGAMFRSESVREVYDQLSLQYIDSPVAYQPSLSQLMNAQMASWGWNSGDYMNQLAEFAVGDPDEIWDQEEKDDPSAWWNQRPY